MLWCSGFVWDFHQATNTSPVETLLETGPAGEDCFSSDCWEPKEIDRVQPKGQCGPDQVTWPIAGWEIESQASPLTHLWGHLHRTPASSSQPLRLWLRASCSKHHLFNLLFKRMKWIYFLGISFSKLVKRLQSLLYTQSGKHFIIF